MAMISLRKANTRLPSEVYHILYVRNLRFNISSEEMHSAIHQIPIDAMLQLALVRPISTGFREERDTFGPISVPHHKLWGAQTQRSLQHFDIYGEREQMSESIIRAFRVLKKCTAKVSMCVKRLVYTNDQGECSNFLCDLKPGADVKIT